MGMINMWYVENLYVFSLHPLSREIEENPEFVFT